LATQQAHIVLDGDVDVRGGFTVGDLNADGTPKGNVVLRADTTVIDSSFEVRGDTIILDANTRVLGDFSVGGTRADGSPTYNFVVVVDDLISGGTTMTRTARACRERGAREVHAAASHAVFTGDAGRKLATADLDSVVVTDSIADARERAPELGGKLSVLAPLFAEVLRRG